MINKNVCPNCGQLYDTDLTKCPLCGAVPQVVETEAPVQRKRITENERKQRRADRREQEQETRLRKKEEQLRLDADLERQIEAEEARRKEEKRRKKEEKKAAKQKRQEESGRSAAVVPKPRNDATPMPARMSRPPEPVYADDRDRGRVPRAFVVLSFVLLLATLVIGGSYLLWKLDVVELPVYDQIAARRKTGPAEPSVPDTGTGTAADTTAEAPVRVPSGDEILCKSLQLDRTEITFEAAGDQTQLKVSAIPEETTEDMIFTSSDEHVVKSSPVGILTAIGPGEATVTVTCGEIKVECWVICAFEAEEGASAARVDVDHLELIKTDMSFFSAGENYVLSVTNVPAGTPVSWSSLDTTVATVDQNGHVVAVGAGTTKVVAQVGGLTAACIVRCKFPEE